MTVWAFNSAQEEKNIDYISHSFYEGVSRFGWSYEKTSDLNYLKSKSLNKMNESEIDCWNRSHFLLNVKKGDWVVHINTPQWGRCLTAKIDSEYNFEKETEVDDFRHFFYIDKSSIIEFDRNNDLVHPIISRRLKLRGHYWRIYNEKEFFESLDNLKEGHESPNSVESVGIRFLKNEINPLLLQFTNKIHRTHPEKKLERFISQIFTNMPNVLEVNENGSGWKSDFGADIIVKYLSGIGISGLQKEETLVVQVKSYTGPHDDLKAVEQIEMAIKKFDAQAGLIISTGESTDSIEKAIEKVSNKIEKPIILIAGENVAKFILKYEKGLLLDV